jgi:hypothetical protein
MQNALHLPIEHDHQEKIKVLNLLLTETIHLASSDFLHLCNILAAPDNSEDKEDVSQAVKELQHVDALRQKLQHMLDFHNAALNGENASNEDGDEVSLLDIIGLVLKLNYYQLIAAHEDFSKAVSKVQGLMRKMKVGNLVTTFFVNLQRINDNFKNITSTLHQLSGTFMTTSDFDLSQVADYFSDRYSMMSERIVLNWCVSSEYESLEEFKRYYSSQDRNGSVELF